ncbi:MAG: hypothetical protein Q9N34_04115 [Aquificota bacterium]|nr:hypothetical protein [Aquificota bacterium]
MYDYRELLSKSSRRRDALSCIILKKGREYEVSIEGFYREWSGSVVRTKVTDANELAGGFILMKMYFQALLACPSWKDHLLTGSREGPELGEGGLDTRRKKS